VNVIAVNTEMEGSSVDDVRQTEDIIVSQWREVSANEKHQMRKKVNGILRPLGFETCLLVVKRADSIAVFFNCMTPSAFTSLHDQWYTTGHLKSTLESLFTLLSGDRVHIKKLTWPECDYERCLKICTEGLNEKVARGSSAPARPPRDSTEHTKISTRPNTAPAVWTNEMLSPAESQFEDESAHDAVEACA